MQRQMVSSSRIRSVGWENNTLEIEFHDRTVYQYFNVNFYEYISFMNSSSLGHQLSVLDKYHKYVKIY